MSAEGPEGDFRRLVDEQRREAEEQSRARRAEVELRIEAEMMRNQQIVDAIRNSNSNAQEWISFAANVPRYREEDDIDEWIETAVRHRPEAATPAKFWKKLSLRVPQSFHDALASIWADAQGLSDEARLNDAFKRLRKYFGDGATSSAILRDIMDFRKHKGESTAKLTSRFRSLLHKYIRKCRDDGIPHPDQDAEMFREAFMRGANVLEQLEIPETLEQTFMKTKKYLRRASLARSDQDQAAASTLQRKARGAYAAEEDPLNSIMARMDTMEKKMEEKFLNMKQDLNDKVVAMSTLLDRERPGPQPKRRRTAPEQQRPGEGPACLMFQTESGCKNGAKCLYLHGNGEGQVQCRRGNGCRQNACRFLHHRS
jgi:predicted HicB family RNase H-like nuclease